MRVFGGCTLDPRKQPFTWAGASWRCVRARIQTAPAGMNYLEESLFCLGTVRRARAHKVLLRVSQETTLIHHPGRRSVPTTQPPTPGVFPSMLFESAADVPASHLGGNKTRAKIFRNNKNIQKC